MSTNGSDSPFHLPPSMPRRARERIMRREAILEAAQAVFAERGYTNATLEEIAQRAEFGKGTLYNYFERGKEGLLFAIFDRLYDDMCALIAASFTPEKQAGRPPRDVFQGFIESCLQFFLDRKDVFLILVKEAQRLFFSDDKEKAMYFVKQRERIVNALVPPLEEGIASGVLKPLPVHAIAHMLLGNINGIQMHLFMERNEHMCLGDVEAALMTPADAARFLTTLLFDGLLTRPDPRTPGSAN